MKTRVQFLGYVRKMYASRRNLCLFVIILVQIINVLGRMDECEVIQSIPSKNSDQENDPDPGEGIQIEENKTIESNVTVNNSSSNVTKVNCLTDKVYGPVEIVNATRLMKLLMLEPGSTNRSINNKEGRLLPGTCVIVLFYARWCIFSSQAAPHFNAIPRSFPHIKAVAIDAIKYQHFNAQYGIVGVPTLMLVHNGKPVAKFNGTVYKLEYFWRFITHITNLQSNGSLYVTSLDFAGPVSSTPSNETDYCLVLSWVFIATCALYFTLQSRWWQQFVELVQNTWRESNAQHEHVD
ncbi:thioredoxin domain-containing protein 15 [Hylaeus anthracinus]|uniref:thioredoxin domain-containing protein 15 n=1 Tax=Hylaeus volcanicus TaxID=313075 RepID=UPI0023B7C149|nr:thioredoxin domain-containing protein 15 [Hylaeus volcanicus]XP_053998646.1 thioredoxin domain-containing protein 15 [Hylaeus anthracinus]